MAKMLTYEEELALSDRLELRAAARDEVRDIQAAIDSYDVIERPLTYREQRQIAMFQKQIEEHQNAIKSGDAAAQELVLAYLKHLYKLAWASNRRYNSHGDFDMIDDLIQHGTVAMLVCTNKFSARKGVRFNTYYIPHVQKMMRQVVASYITPYKVISEDYITGLGMKEENLAPLRQGFKSTDDPDIMENAKLDMFSKLEDDSSTDAANVAIDVALSQLPETQGQALRLSLGLDRGTVRTIEEVAHAMGTRRQKQVQRWEWEAIDMMNHPFFRTRMVDAIHSAVASGGISIDSDLDQPFGSYSISEG